MKKVVIKSKCIGTDGGFLTRRTLKARSALQMDKQQEDERVRKTASTCKVRQIK